MTSYGPSQESALMIMPMFPSLSAAGKSAGHVPVWSTHHAVPFLANQGAAMEKEAPPVMVAAMRRHGPVGP